MLIWRVKYIFCSPFTVLSFSLSSFGHPFYLFMRLPLFMCSCIFYCVVSLSCSVNSLYSMWATWRAWRDKACTHCSAIHSGQLDRLKKTLWKEILHNGHREVHNANSFPNTTDCFHHNEGKQTLLLSSTSTNNTLTKTSQPTFCSQTKPPRPSKRSQWRKSSFRVSSPFP